MQYRCSSSVPVLDRELAHSTKLGFVLGDERKPEKTSVSRDQQVIGTDGCSATSQIIADVRIVLIYGLLHRKNGKCAEDSLDSVNQACRTVALSAEPQFACDDNAGTDSIVSNPSETLRSDAFRLLHEPGKDIGVEQM
jgi:hypothetical protein